MADNKSRSFDSIMLDLREKRFSPVYCLMGDEPYYIDKIADYIGTEVLSEEEKCFNQDVVFGSDVTEAMVSDMIRRYPVMADHRVVIVREAQALKGFDHIVEYLKSPLAQNILVLCHKNGIIDRRKKIIAEAERVGVVFESRKLRDRDLPPFIESYLKDRGVGIDRKSADLIASHAGADIARLTGEMDKLILALPENDRNINPSLVERLVGISKEFNTFELRDAIVNKDVLKANRIIKYFNNNPKAGNIYSVMPVLFSYFQNLLIVIYSSQNGSVEGIARTLGLKSPWAAKDYLAGLRNYNGKKVMDIIGKMRETDAKSKGINNPNTPSGELLKELIYFILH